MQWAVNDLNGQWNATELEMLQRTSTGSACGRTSLRTVCVQGAWFGIWQISFAAASATRVPCLKTPCCWSDRVRRRRPFPDAARRCVCST